MLPFSRKICTLMLNKRPAIKAAMALPNLVHHVRPPLSHSIHAAAGIFTRRKIGPMSYALLIIPGAAFCLGCWQVKRRLWKLGLIRELEEKINQPAVILPDDLSKLSEMEYQRVFLQGTFDHSKELLLGPRPVLHAGRYKEGGSLMSTGSSGFLVVTPFKLANSGHTILVNRGWVSKRGRDPVTRLEGQVTDEQLLTGVVRLQENRPPFMPHNTSTSKSFLYRDVATMAEAVDCAPVFVDACEGVPGGPLSGQTNVTLRNEHMSYLLTWYSLSFITGFLWYKRYINPRSFV